MRDADILEQLGAVAILRTVSKVGRDTRFQTFADAVAALRRSLEKLPALLRLPRSRELAEPRIRALREWLRARGVPFLINDDVDLALACDADGLHVGQGDLPCAEARRRLGPQRLVGVSVSTVAEAAQAMRDGADYLGVSPIFSTPTKPDAPAPTGLAGLCAIRAAVRLPLVAIGGIHAGNATDVLAAGADGIAVVSAILAAPDPRAAAQALRVLTGRINKGKSPF